MGFLAPIFAAIGGALTAVAGFVGGWGAVARFALTLAISALLAPKKANTAQRQASVLELTIGETPRRAGYGEYATGGSLMFAWNDGGSNEYETRVISLADVLISGLSGYFVNDTYYAFTVPEGGEGDGAQLHADLQDGGPALWMQFRRGEVGQTRPSIITNYGIGEKKYDEEDEFDGIAFVVVRYKVSDKVWKGGRPEFRFVLKGVPCYDPRLDDTVPGGEGDHRYDDPSTWEWSENAAVCYYNFIRGAYNYLSDPPQLMVGPGKSTDEAPPENYFGLMNLCDEEVALKAGGTEPRYRVGCEIPADEEWIISEEHFAASMAGALVERNGTIMIEGGAAKTAAFSFTDGELVKGSECVYQEKTTRDRLVNTIVPKYVDRTQLWEGATAPIRRSLEDITADGEVREQPLELVFVTSQTQAQRCGEIERRRQRLQATANVELPPRFMLAEDGDWVSWQSDRRFHGETRTFEVQGTMHNTDEVRTKLFLRRITSSVFAWNPETDELDHEAPAYLPPGAIEDAELEGFTVEPITITSGTSQQAAIRVLWTPPVDTSIKSVLIEWRQQSAPATVFSETTANVSAGEKIISANLIGGQTYEVRITPLTQPKRGEIASAWLPVAVDDTSGAAVLSFTPIATENMVVVGRSLRKIEVDDTPIEWDDEEPLEWDDDADGVIEFEADGWNGSIHSAEGYTEGATALVIAYTTDKALMFGLSFEPALSSHYDHIDYAWRLDENGKATIYESGALVWDNDGDPLDYAQNDVPSVTYDNAFVRYYISGSLKREVAAPSGLQVFFDSSFNDAGARVDGVSFTASARAGDVIETRWIRSVAPPATPTGEPEGWTTIIPAGDAALWSVEAPKSQSGALLGDWSTPVLRSTPNWRGQYAADVIYYREDAVYHNSGTYKCRVESTLGNAPSGNAQSNTWWEPVAAGTGTPPPPTGGGFSASIAIPSSSGATINLFDLAVANGYDGEDDATITFTLADGELITGPAGAPNGGIGIDTGLWSTAATLDLNLVINGEVDGGGGKGGNAGKPAGNGGTGGDAIYCRQNIDVTIGATGRARAGGGGGSGASAGFGGSLAGNGGGGQPNGPAGTGTGAAGTDGTPSAVGLGGGSAGDGGIFGGGGQTTLAIGGPPGFAIRKNGKTVNVTNAGTVVGTIG